MYVAAVALPFDRACSLALKCQRRSRGTDHHVCLRFICSCHGRLHLPCGEFERVIIKVSD